MEILENVSLATLTTLQVGGNARFVARCEHGEDIQSALAFAGERALPWYVLGGGSNVLASDAGYEGVIIQPLLKGITFGEPGNGTELANDSAAVEKSDTVLVTAAVGEEWDAFVQKCLERELWGLENLAGIPGLVGGAPIQNIGAYGADVSQTIVSVEALATGTHPKGAHSKEVPPKGALRGAVQLFSNAECAFGYRDSFFKQNQHYILLRVTFALSKTPAPRTSYTDLRAYQEKHGHCTTPNEIAHAVREIRSRKFPDLRVNGTAGSFFKNPCIPKSHYEALAAKYEGLPGFPASSEDARVAGKSDTAASEELVKIPLAWILDNVLHLRGFAMGPVRLFEEQPLVVVTEKGATAEEVDALGTEVAKKVFDATQIVIEREVRMV